MADGIRINDASVEISTGGLDALLNRQGADLTVRKIDLSVSSEALNTLLAKFAPEGAPTATAEISEGRAVVSSQKDGQTMRLDLQLGALRVTFGDDGIRLSSEGSADGGGG